MAFASRASRIAYALLFLILPPLTSVAARAGTIVYTFNQTVTSASPTGNPAQSDTILGTITTDGTLGALRSGDIVSSNLQLIDNLNAVNDFTLTSSNSAIALTDGLLSATDTDLSFDYSGRGDFLIQATPLGSGAHYLCLSHGTYPECFDGETISPGAYLTDSVVTTGAAIPTGSVPLNQGAATPEPTAGLLMLSGLVAVAGAAGRKAKARVKAGNSVNS